jgi:hypothetical protein
VVGGGSAGCMLALEGGEGKDLAVRVPAGRVFMVPSKPFKLSNRCFYIL